ncbi:MAG: sigma-70 family RNA polymerase sigma factor [Ktedonobacteraceae bacterium]|nr:sigma-70 family RNA polymerase sigma factor [Ktedonobacteraceae bacterium]
MENFERYYPLLTAIARRMLDRTNDVEDFVQESYIRYASATAADYEIRSLKAFLTTILTRLCLDYRKSARAQYEQPLGLSLLPAAPVADTEESLFSHIEQHEALASAITVLLQCLTAEERTIFLLREIFAYSYDEIAALVGKNQAACRQLLHRARLRLAERRPRFAASPQERRQLLDGFLAAAQQGDIQTLLDSLHTHSAVQSTDQKSDVADCHENERTQRHVVRAG